MALGAVLVCFVSPDTYGAQKKHPAPTAQATEPAVKPDAAPAAATPEAKPPQSAPNPTKAASAWTPAEIADARARCAVVLQRVHAVALPHEPIREGACGAPGPVELISIGRNPEVALSPPAIVRCDLIEPLVTWFEQDVQPLARKLLKSQVIRIETMSSYDCRNVYGMKGAKLSQHALANALDIGGFITASAKTAEVLDEWGKPQREILAEAAERKQAAEAAASKTAQAGVTGNPVPGALPSMVPSTAGAAAAGLARSTIVDGLPRAEVIATASPINDANRLGGPALQRDSPTRPTPSIDNPDPKMQAFLHEAHKAACRIFGTTLGPEANAAHRNHFHVDMAERKFTKICD
ncbi:MAG: extensin family protein [Hyphomicrobium sp.]|nr:MAG: extensin family protein [Hyphomicrobium sp.]